MSNKADKYLKETITEILEECQQVEYYYFKLKWKKKKFVGFIKLHLLQARFIQENQVILKEDGNTKTKKMNKNRVQLVAKTEGVGKYKGLTSEEIVSAIARHGVIKEDNGKLVKYLMKEQIGRAHV